MRDLGLGALHQQFFTLFGQCGKFVVALVDVDFAFLELAAQFFGLGFERGDLRVVVVGQRGIVAGRNRLRARRWRRFNGCGRLGCSRGLRGFWRSFGAGISVFAFFIVIIIGRIGCVRVAGDFLQRGAFCRAVLIRFDGLAFFGGQGCQCIGVERTHARFS